LADTVVDLEDLVGAVGRSLVEQLRETTRWDARFAALDAALLAWFTTGRTGNVLGVQWAWGQIERSAGRAPVGARVSVSAGDRGDAAAGRAVDGVGGRRRVL
jgi:hypothetical protein